MIHSFFKDLILVASVFAAAFSSGGAAIAQDCSIEQELIFEFAAPKIGAYSVWDAAHGDVTYEERYKTGLLESGLLVMAAGERYSFEGGPMSLILHKLEKRGRIVWEKEHKIAGLQSVVKILPHPQGYLIAGEALKQGKNEKGSDLWFGVFSPDGDLLTQSRIARSDEDLDLEDIILLPTSKRFLVAAYVQAADSDNGFSRLYFTDQSLSVQQERSFTPGVENKILSITEVAPGEYAAAGYVWSSDGRRSGWLLSLAKNLAIDWEQQYPRGRGAKFSDIRLYVGDRLIVSGDTVPYGEGNRAGWVMMVDRDSGMPLWQRYYSGDMHYDAIDSLVSPDGLISVLLTAQKPAYKDDDHAASDKYDYVRLLTIDPRGLLMISDEYFNAKGARAFEMFFGPEQQRILVGSTDAEYELSTPVPEGEPPKVAQSLDAWVISAVAMANYKDPCVQATPYMP